MTTYTRHVFPPIEAFDSGLLAVGDGSSIYWEISGNPEALPALHLHGGPGGGMKTGYRRRFDPQRFLIVGFEQRGCGRSVPLVTGDRASLARNTTQTLIGDIEQLRQHLAIERWLVTGVSWGTTLALAYAQAEPSRVRAVALMAATTTTASEVEWITESMGRIFPEAWRTFAHASGARAGERVIDAYYRRIKSDDPVERDAAARAWCAWEDVHVSLTPHGRPNPDFEDPTYRGVFATLLIHYWKQAAFLPPDGILSGMHRLAGIAGHIVHGRLDISGPADIAWTLHHAWPGSRLTIVNDEGHGGPRMLDAFEEAISALAGI